MPQFLLWNGWKRCRKNFDEFCRFHPALFFGICLLWGAWMALSLETSRDFQFFLCLSFALLLSGARLGVAILLVVAAFFSTSSRVTSFSHPFSTQGTIVAHVTDRHLVTFHGKTLWRVDFFVHEFRNEEKGLLAKGMSLHTHVRPPCPVQGGKVYQMKGRLLIDESLQASFRPSWPTLVEKGRSFSFVELRVTVRQVLERIFTSLFGDQEVRMVAGALTFGLYKDPYFQNLMHRAGIEHVLAISGFHFGVVAALALFFIRGIRPRFRALVAMGLLTLYLLIVGPLPSVMRSWWAAIIGLLGVLLGRKSSGLNCLGVGLIAAVILDPLSLSQIGCQLSFLATAAILLFSRYASALSSSLVQPKRREEFVSFSFADQALTTVLHRIYPALSLILPVWAVIVPYQLAFMEEISLLGILYNLCIPLLFSLAMPCIILAVIFSPLPFFPQGIAYIGSIPLRCGIYLVQSMPEGNWTMSCEGRCSESLALGIIFAVFLVGAILESRNADEQAEIWKACL